MKRNVLIKTYETLNAENAPVEKKEELEKRYDDAYTAYLEALDKYVLDTIYKKVKNETATQFESTALSQYYGIVQLKDREYNEYKYRKQKYLLELDKESVDTSAKEKVQEKYNKFYVDKMDTLYKAILKNYSIKLADTTNIYDTSKEWIYVKIFYTLEEYIKNKNTLQGIVKNCDEQYNLHIDLGNNIEGIIPRKEVEASGFSKSTFCA